MICNVCFHSFCFNNTFLPPDVVSLICISVHSCQFHFLKRYCVCQIHNMVTPVILYSTLFRCKYWIPSSIEISLNEPLYRSNKHPPMERSSSKTGFILQNTWVSCLSVKLSFSVTHSTVCFNSSIGEGKMLKPQVLSKEIMAIVIQSWYWWTRDEWYINKNPLFFRKRFLTWISL